MLNRFLQFIKKHALFNDGDKLLVGVSGGLDSMVLLSLCKQANLQLKVAHCNFGLRAEESDADARFVRERAKALGFDYFEKKFDTKDYAVANGISTQMAARELRYQWFDDLMSQHELTKLAVAHHLDDNIETVLLNLIRGTSVAGLRGMNPISGNIVRPLLEFKRGEIEAFALANGLKWREDSSNSSDDYKRNFVRHNIIPQIDHLNQGFHNTFQRNINRAQELEQVFNQRIELLKPLLKPIEGAIQVDKSDLEKHQIGPLQLFELIKEFGFNYDQCEEIIDGLDRLSGKQYFTDDYLLTIDRKSLFIEENNQPEFVPVVINEADKSFLVGESHYSLVEHDDPLEILKNKETAFLDKAKLSYPLKIRRAEVGDYFYPLGMKGKKKLSDFMIDEKIPLNLKSKVLVLTTGRDIVWVIGHRIDDRYKVQATTKSILQIKPIALHV